MEYHAKDIDSIFKELDSQKEGLNDSQVQEHTAKYGLNIMQETKKDGIIAIFLRQFKSFVVWVLLLAAGISFAIGHTVEFVVVIAIIAFVILMGFFQELKASKDMQALIELTPKKTFVLRNNIKTEILTSDITIGDILVLHRGDVVGADGRIIECSDLKIDESPLTGESISVSKICATLPKDTLVSDQTNMVFAGCSVTSGTAKFIVTAIAEDTELGKISKLIKNIKEEVTPLQKRLDKLSKQISIGVILLSVAAFFIGLSHNIDVGSMLIFSLAMIVSGVPESLPTVVAVTLASGVKKMAKQNAIIKKLPSVETLGTCTVICSDKTGTLTQNKMVVESIFTSDTEIKVKGEGYNPEGIFLKEDIEVDPKQHKTVLKALEVGILCNNSDIKQDNDEWVVDGEATEGALVTLAQKAGIVKYEYHNKYSRIKEHPFDSNRKLMSTVHTYKGKQLIYSKGAPEIILRKAKSYLHKGKIQKITQKIHEQFSKKQEEYANQGLRVLALAYKEHKGSLSIDKVESGLILVGLVAIRDPPDPNARESVLKCLNAGIKVVMITGDNEVTARSIAKEIGIYRRKDMVITGKELDELSDDALKEVVDDITVCARVTPEHKLRIVKAFQEKGHIVAMTGDGVNDAPALKKADIGIAMGRRGTQVAKESAELILKDDNFSTITNAVEQGRAIYENIRKFIYYLLVGSVSEVLIFLVAILVGFSLPLTALMILFLNLVTSELPALGLGAEKPSEKIMKRRPRNPKEGILSDYLLFKIAEVVPLIVVGTISVFIWQLVSGAPLAKAQTFAFATLICFELFHALNARMWNHSVISKDFFGNWYVLGGIVSAFLLTLIVIYIPFFQSIFGTVNLPVSDWYIIVAVSGSVLFLIELQKTLIQAEVNERSKLEVSMLPQEPIQ